MKKMYLLLLTIFTLLIGGCTVAYNFDDDDSSINDGDNENDNNNNNNNGNNNSNNGSENNNPPSYELTIDENALFYPNTLNISSSLITKYDYVDENLINEYKIYSAFYSSYYDTIYIAYDLIDTPIQTLKAKDLYEIEKHAINYFVSDANRSEDKNYLKAVRIYPDRLASSCRKGLNDDYANNINGCADYGGIEAIIDLNNTTSLNDFYNPKIEYTSPVTYIKYEPMRDTFAHEYGHISTFYHMVYKNDENYEDYLKIRLKDKYSTIYPNGLPSSYSSLTSYDIQPEEILADDFVELFYNTSSKKETDTYEYELNYNDKRNSLETFSSVHMIKNNANYPNLYNELKNYYSKFLNYENRTTYSKPKVITNQKTSFEYYESYSHIGTISKLKSVSSSSQINLIVIGEVTVNSSKYYRVIISNTFKLENGTYNKKDVGKKMGYVKAADYVLNPSVNLYKIDQCNGEPLTKNNIVPIENNNSNKLYILPFYDFSYVINTTNNTNYATTYDYLSSNLPSTHKYEVNIHSFGTLIE